MYASRVACCFWWDMMSMPTGQTDRRTDDARPLHYAFRYRHGQRNNYSELFNFSSRPLDSRYASTHRWCILRPVHTATIEVIWLKRSVLNLFKTANCQFSRVGYSQFSFRHVDRHVKLNGHYVWIRSRIFGVCINYMLHYSTEVSADEVASLHCTPPKESAAEATRRRRPLASGACTNKQFAVARWRARRRNYCRNARNNSTGTRQQTHRQAKAALLSTGLRNRTSVDLW